MADVGRQLSGGRELGVGEVAKLLGVDRGTARRWLKELEAKHGPEAVYMRAGRYYTTEWVLARYHPEARASEARIVATVRDLSERVAELETREDARVRAQLAFQRQSRQWFLDAMNQFRRPPAPVAPETAVAPKPKRA